MQPAGFGCPCHGGAYDTEGNRTAGPPVRSLDRFAFSIVNGNLMLGSPSASATSRAREPTPRSPATARPYPGVHVDGIERWLYPHTGAGVLSDGEVRPQHAQLEAAVLYPLDWVEERTGLVGGVKYFLFRNVPRDIELDADAGLRDADRVPRPGDDRRLPRDVLQARPGQGLRVDRSITNDVTLGWLVRGMHQLGRQRASSS